MRQERIFCASRWAIRFLIYPSTWRTLFKSSSPMQTPDLNRRRRGNLFTVTVLDPNSNSNPEMLALTLEASLGTLNGQSALDAVVAGGVFTGTLRTGTVAGTSTITATVRLATGVAQVVFLPGPPVRALPHARCRTRRSSQTRRQSSPWRRAWRMNMATPQPTASAFASAAAQAKSCRPSPPPPTARRSCN